ncbi:MAG: LuxR family transcriptional regulator, partial [Actinomycetota bacterium]|nr:LuxR family transcriptional regulator [Actinomycetota bacterium]
VDRRILAAAVLSIIGEMERSAGVVIAIDDLQWVDASSQAVLAFVARRLRGRTALLLTERPEPQREPASIWLRLDATDGVERLSLRPLSLGGLHEVISHRLGRSFPRPTMVRIGEVSGGNPFYALELARGLDDTPLRGDAELPSSLAELVRLRVGALREDVREVLLVAASAADPTVEMVAQATGFGIERTVELLEGGDGAGIVSVTGNRVRFEHPVLARGVYTDADPARRRLVHRKLAGLVAEPELRARHLALAATSGDPLTLAALDEAAAAAHARGAPAAAAELLDLAIGLGGDTVQRRITAADNHIRAGDLNAARQLLGPAIEREPGGSPRAHARALLATVMLHTEGYPQGVDELRRALGDAAGDRLATTAVGTLLARALVRAERFGDATGTARTVLAEAEELGAGPVISSALAVNALVDHVCGRGHDRAALRRAVALEDSALDAPVTLSASAVDVELLICSGEVGEAASRLASVRDRLAVPGADTEMLWVS